MGECQELRLYIVQAGSLRIILSRLAGLGICIMSMRRFRLYTATACVLRKVVSCATSTTKASAGFRSKSCRFGKHASSKAVMLSVLTMSASID